MKTMIPLPGFEPPQLWRLDRDDQHALWYLTAKDGTCDPQPRMDYARLIALGLVVRLPDGRMSLTPDGHACVDAEIDRQVRSGITFHD